jgi:hypothetical protein
LFTETQKRKFNFFSNFFLTFLWKKQARTGQKRPVRVAAGRAAGQGCAKIGERGASKETEEQRLSSTEHSRALH